MELCICSGDIEHTIVGLPMKQITNERFKTYHFFQFYREKNINTSCGKSEWRIGVG